MKKTNKVVLAVLLLPGLVGFLNALTSSMGQASIRGVSISVNNGPSDDGTQRVAIASMTSESPLYVAVVSSVAISNTVSIANTPGTPIYTQPISSTAVSGTVTVLQGTTPWDVSGSTLVVNLSSTSSNVTAFQGGAWNVGINTGTNNIGTVSGSSVTVSGTVAISQATPGVTNAVFVTNSSTQTIVKSTTVTKANVSATTTSSQLLPAEPTRIGVECASLCTNGRVVYLNINSASAATATDYPLEPCSSWVPPAGLVPTGAIQVIAGSLTQVIRCVSYLP